MNGYNAGAMCDIDEVGDNRHAKNAKCEGDGRDEVADEKDRTADARREYEEHSDNGDAARDAHGLQRAVAGRQTSDVDVERYAHEDVQAIGDEIEGDICGAGECNGVEVGNECAIDNEVACNCEKAKDEDEQKGESDEHGGVEGRGLLGNLSWFVVFVTLRDRDTVRWVAPN